MRRGDDMAKIETYNRLFLDIAEAVKSAIPNREDAVGIAQIILRSKPAILRKYLDINRHIKAEFVENGVERLDRHKCAACFMVAFEKRLMITDDNKKHEKYREKIAIAAAMAVLVGFAESEAKEQGNHRLISHIAANNGFVVPESTKDKSPYEEIWAIELRKIYTGRQEIKAAFSAAKDLFLVEAYNNKPAEVGT